MEGSEGGNNRSRDGSVMKNDLQKYLSETIERLMADAIKATLNNPRESLFLLSFAAASRRAAKTREGFEKEGEHIPPFLIASITRDCNLHCAGCFAHANNNYAKDQKHREMTVEEWDGVFAEAETLGISFIFLVGGEPMLCRDVIESAGHHGNILFPIITNGILMDDEYIRLFDKHRNLLAYPSQSRQIIMKRSLRAASWSCLEGPGASWFCTWNT